MESKLFQPCQVGHLRLKNRCVSPPMVHFDSHDGSGLVGEQSLEDYRKLAAGGAGLVIVEACAVLEQGRVSPRQLGLWHDRFIPGLARIAQVIHAEGAKCLVQIHHAGLKSPPEVTGQPKTASDYQEKGVKASAFTVPEIEELERAFVQAAVRVHKAGFDGIELHCGYKYLLGQFLSGAVNKREDAYNRADMKLPLDILGGIRAAVPGEFLLAVKMAGNDPSHRECVRYAREFQRAGAGLLEVTAGFLSAPPGDLDYEENPWYNWVLHMALSIREQVQIPVIGVNSIATPEQACHLVDQDLCDLVAVGRGLLVDNDWFLKAERGEAIRPCLHCRRCMWYQDSSRCPGRTQQAIPTK